MQKNLGLLGVLLALCQLTFSQSVNDYRTAQSGNWNEVSTWERFDGSDWVVADSFPTRAAGVITLQNGHYINIVADVIADEIVVESACEINVTNATLWVDIDPSAPANAIGIDLYGSIFLWNSTLHTDQRKVQVFGRLNLNNSDFIAAAASDLEPTLVVHPYGKLDIDDDQCSINAFTAFSNYGTMYHRGGFIGPVFNNYGFVHDVGFSNADTLNNYGMYEKGGHGTATLHATTFFNTGYVWISDESSIIVQQGFGPGSLEVFATTSVTIKGSVAATPQRIDLRISPSNPGQPARHGRIIFDGGLDLSTGIDSLFIKDFYNVTNGTYEMITTINGDINGDFEYIELPEGYTIENTGTKILLHRFVPANVFRSKQSGNWTDLNTWEIFSGGSWIDADHIPLHRDSTITIRNAHTVTLDSSIYVDDLTVASGATLNIVNCELETNYFDGDSQTVAIYIYGTVNLFNSLLDLDSDNQVYVYGTINFDNSNLYQSFYAPNPDFVVQASGVCNIFNFSANMPWERVTNYGTINRLSGSMVYFDNYGILIDSGYTTVYSNMLNTKIYRLTGPESQAHFNVFNNQHGIITGEGTITLNNNISGGAVLPGDSIGMLKIISALPSTINKLMIQLKNGSGAGTGHDQLVIEGGLDQALSADTLIVAEIASLPNGNYTIVKLQNNGDNHITGTFNNLSLPAGYTIVYHADSIVISKFTGPVPTITISSVSGAEGNSGTRQFKFVVRLSFVPTSTVQVSYFTNDSTGVGGSDFISTSGIVTFAPGQRTDTIRVLVNGDKLVEATEHFTVRLSNATNATITQASAYGAITNDDTYPTLIATNRTIIEGNLADSTIMVQFRLNKSYPDSVKFNYATSDSTATAGIDYLSASGTVVFNPGDTLAYIPVSIQGDRINEPNDIFHINPSAQVNCIIGATVRSRLTITNDDQLPRVIFNTVSIPEGNNDQWNNTSVTVRLTKAYPLPVTVSYHTVDSSAVNGLDYQATSGVITFAPEDTLETISISILGDRFVESDEYFGIVIDTLSNATITSPRSNTRITNDDSYPGIVLSPVTVTEGDATPVQAIFTVRLRKKYPAAVTLNYVTQSITANAGGDFVYDSAQLIFPPDDSVATIAVAILPDLLDELNETFIVRFSSPVNATLTGAGTATGTIIDNDPVPAIVINDTIVNETDGEAILTLRLSRQSEKQVRVIIRTLEGTAKDTLDYRETISDTVYFEPGETVQTIGVPIYQDVVAEVNENFSVLLQSVTNATSATAQGGDNRGVVTIINNAALLTRITNTNMSPVLQRSTVNNAQPAIIVPSVVRRGTLWKIQNLPATRHEMSLFNASGQRVMRSSGIDKGILVNIPAGSYFYIISARNSMVKPQFYKGQILVMD